jgi:monoamine oxidase
MSATNETGKGTARPKVVVNGAEFAGMAVVRLVTRHSHTRPA